MTYTLEIKKEYALPLLKVLEEQDAIELKVTEEVSAPQLARKRTFDALRLDTRGFKFNREEANER